MTPNREKWHFFPVKILSASLRRITSKHYADFYCLKCFHSFETEKKVELHKKACENKDFRNEITPSKDNKILEFNQYQNSDKAAFVIYEDLYCMIEKIDGYKNNPENSSTTKVREHTPSGFSMSTISSFRRIEDKRNIYIEVTTV